MFADADAQVLGRNTSVRPWALNGCTLPTIPLIKSDSAATPRTAASDGPAHFSFTPVTTLMTNSPVRPSFPRIRTDAVVKSTTRFSEWT